MSSMRRFLDRIGAINARYRSPRIAMSGAVRISLMLLRVYLLFLVILMIYKFVSIVTKG